MAHAALFDDHPIALYLRESGEVPEQMPGGLDEFAREPTHGNPPYDPVAKLQTWIYHLSNTIQAVFEPILIKFRGPPVSSEFAERFKYTVISSALLSSSLSYPFINRESTPTTPGHFDQRNAILSPTPPAVTPIVPGPGPHITYTLACLAPLALIRGYYLSFILLLAAIKYISDGGLNFSTSLAHTNGEEPWKLTIDCLEALIVANNAWENVVSETFRSIQAEEHPASISSPLSSLTSLRTALSYSLHTTETQCDNVRQLLAALTSPILLSQLSHMYAPPSPSLTSPSPRRPRPMSLAPPLPEHSHATRVRASSLSNSPIDAYTYSRAGLSAGTSLSEKRSTWSGSNISPIHRSSRREHASRPSYTALFRAEDLESSKTPILFPSSSSSHPSTLATTESFTADADADPEDESFGVAALDLHRKRRRIQAPLLATLSPPSSFVYLRSPDAALQSNALHNPPHLTSSLGSNFTSLSSSPSSRQTTTHHSHIPLSTLHLTLQSAVGAKRFACSHLLALRFSDFNNPQPRKNLAGSDVDDEDGSYWDDVRSVISLLTSTLEGASARLSEALADTVRRQEHESGITITQEESCFNSASSDISIQLPPSFAPMPSHLARFAAHIDAISSALDDARDHLRQCVASLQDDAQATGGVSEEDSDSSPVSLQAYERLRRELGLAFRECERGRGTLLELVKRRTPGLLAKEEDEEEEEEAFVHHEEQLSSGESDKTLYNATEVHEVKDVLYTDHGQEDHDSALAVHDDDTTASHSISNAAQQQQHLTPPLPPPGIEQVFESVSSSAQPFVRERSKLSREERIRLAKAQREGLLEGESHPSTTFPFPFPIPPSPLGGREKWGPGGEVVQELKDVIWQVSERRRKMVERSKNSLVPPPALPPRSVLRSEPRLEPRSEPVRQQA